MTTRRVLVIEDNKDNRILVKFALESVVNWKVLMASNGVDGIIKAETEPLDLILLDYIMPDLDGLAVLDILKSNSFTCSIPVIFTTAMVKPELLCQLKNTLAIGIITKPFNIINFDSQIAEICQWDKFNNFQKI